MFTVGIIGLGKWARRILSNISDYFQVKYCSNRTNKNSKDWLSDNFPSITHTFNYNQILSDKNVQVVFITTPISTHFEIVKAALESGKHVFVEKPLAMHTEQIEELFNIARRQRLNLFAGYIFLYSNVLDRLCQINKKDRILHVDMNWLKYGSFKEDLSWNLLTHELSIIYRLMDLSFKDNDLLSFNSSFLSKDKLRVEFQIGEFRTVCIGIDRKSKSNTKTVSVETSSGYNYDWTDGELFQKSDKDSIKLEVDGDRLKSELKYFHRLLNSNSLVNEKDIHIFIAQTVNQLVNLNLSKGAL